MYVKSEFEISPQAIFTVGLILMLIFFYIMSRFFAIKIHDFYNKYKISSIKVYKLLYFALNLTSEYVLILYCKKNIFKL